MIYRFGTFEVDDDEFRLSADGIAVALEPKAMRVLAHLIRNPGRLVRKRELLDAVWQDANVTESVLTRSVGLLRKALHDDSREPQFIETVPTVGYRFVAAITTGEGLHGSAGATDAEPAKRPRPLGRRRELFLVVLLSGCVAVACVGGWSIEKRLRAAAPIRSLAVLPLRNLSGDASQDYFAEGMTDELTTELAGIKTLRVISGTSAMGERKRDKPVAQIAGELKVDAVVEGSVVRNGGRVRITAQLIDARTDRHLWAQSFEADAGDVLSLQDSVAREIAAQTRVVLDPAGSRLKSGPGIDAAAHDAYLRGRFFYDRNDFRRSAEYFQQAIALAPSYASAYAGLADALEAGTTFGIGQVEDVMPRAMAAAKHAIELDPANGEAYAALGSIQTIYLWDWAAAEQNLTRGIALSPNYALVEMKYAAFLDATGRPEEAVAHMRRALSLDPMSFLMTRRLGAVLYLARDYDGALNQLRLAGEINPHLPGAVHNWMSFAYIEKGMLDEAVDHDLTALASDWPKLDAAGLRSVYRRQGWEAYWRARIDALRPYEGQGCVLYETGVSYALLKDTDRALANLNRAVDQRCYEALYLETDPLLDGVRRDRRYKDLLQRVGLSIP